IQGYGLAAHIVLVDRSATLGSRKIGQIVEKLREAKGLTQHQLAERAQVSQSFISILEGGKIESTPPPMIVERLARALDVKREALRWARQHSGPIHLLVSDVVMPLMHGRDLAAELRAIRPGLKVMFMSGASPSEVADHGIGLAFGQPYLVKPFSIAALTNKVRAALDYRSPFSKPPPHS